MFIEMTKIHKNSYCAFNTKIMVNTNMISYIDIGDREYELHFIGGEKICIEPIDIDELNKTLIFLEEKD